ncbi:MAG: hypothetical protein KDC48_17670, partial [Planctomycetes bacterium]|nr:hypothetical protein [Planctomycetota bacterium]
MICRAIALFALLSAAITPTPPQPDSWLPFADQRVVSPSGQRYVVIRADGRGITYELRRRAPGRPAMTAAKKPFQGDDAVIAADPTDRLIVKGKFGQKPLETIVPDGLDGFLMFEKYANVGGGQSVTWIDAAGKAAPDLKLAGIFPVTPAAATRSVSSLWWYQGCFLDEAAKSIVVVAVGDELREVAIADGAVTEPGVERLVAWCKAGTAAGRALALEVASRGAPALRQAGAAVAVQI